MRWELTDDVHEYERRVRGLLAADPARATVALTVLDALMAGQRWAPGPVVLGWCAAGREVVGAVSLTPPFELLLAAVPERAVAPLVDALVERGVEVPGVAGDPVTAEAFATAWAAQQPCDVAVLRRERLHRLGTLAVPDVPGRARAARDADLPLLVDWFARFQREAGMHQLDPEPLVRDRTAQRLLWLWEHDGSAVSMAGRNRTAAGVARVGPVYTPPEHRRHGRGAAVTAACTADALAAGADQVVLFTDLANPTSNGVYRRIGFLPLADRVVLALEPLPSHRTVG